MIKKKELLVVGILIGIFCVVGVSYAIWQVTHVQTGENTLTVGCFKVEFTDANPIQIGKAYPIEDKIGKTLIPYEFIITNTCNDLAAYQINLEVLNDSTMNEHSYIKSMLDEENPNLLTSNPVVEKTLENATTAYKLKKSFLNANETKNFTLRLWLDESTPPNDEIMNSLFKSKVTITTSYIEEAPLASGTLRSVSVNESNGMWQYKENITKVIIEDELKPIEEAIGSFDESSKKDRSVMSYIVENPKENEEEETTYTAYLQSNEKLYLNNGHCLFHSFNKLESIEGMRYLDTTNVADMDYMFYGCSSLMTLDLSNFDTSNVMNMSSMFRLCNSLTSLNLTSLNTANVTDMSWMFYKCSNLTSLNVNHFDTSNVTSMGAMFSGCSSLTELNLSNFNTEKVINMSSMFQECSSFSNVDVRNFNTSSVTSMYGMFNGCSNLTSLDISNFNTTNVTSMQYMFSDCSSLTAIDLSNFNTANVTSMNDMFSWCSTLTELNLSNFNTTNVMSMTSMFKGCSSLTELNLSNFNTTNVMSMSFMFASCSSLTELNLSNFNTNNVSDMSSMFSHCSNLTELNLSNFNTNKASDMSYMFNECKKLTTINYGDNFIYANDANVRYMFLYCLANKPTHESWSGITF